jgi:hypothetical protein
MASKSFSISSASKDEGDSSHTKEGVNMKANEDQPSKSNSNESVGSVKPSKDDVVSPVDVGSTFSFPNNSNEGKDEKKNEEKNSDVKYFACSYCKGQYSTLQGLRGHQNAHKAERALEKQRRKRYDGGASALGLKKSYFTPYNSYRGLGVRMESTIQKTPYTNPRITANGSGYGYGALRLNDILHPSLFNLRNNIEASNNGVGTLGFGGASTSRLHPSLFNLRNNIVGSNAGVGTLGIGGASTSRIEVGTNNKIAAILNIVDSSAATRFSSNTDKKNVMATTSAMDNDADHDSKSNIEEEPSDFDSSGLDLTLRL